MRDTTPGGARKAAARDEIRMRETDRSARRVGEIAAAAARGTVAYGELTSGNVSLAANVEKLVIPGIVVPVEPGRQYRAEAAALIWNASSVITHGSLLLRYLLSADGAVADLTSPNLIADRITIINGGFGCGSHPQRTIPPIDTDQYTHLSVCVSGVVSGQPGGVHGVPAAPAQLWVFDDGAVIAPADENPPI
ncbi:hypothetical protein [Microcystis phage Mwe-JY05]